MIRRGATATPRKIVLLEQLLFETRMRFVEAQRKVAGK